MQLEQTIQRFHQLLSTPPYRDLSWAEQMQARMRAKGLCESGRVIAPVLRPYFISPAQAQRLTRACAQVNLLLEQAEEEAWRNPELLHRLHPLPAEKLLASQTNGTRCSSTLAYSMEASLHNGSVQISSVETCSPVGLGYAQKLAQMFRGTPVVEQFEQDSGGLSRVGCEPALLPSLKRHWTRQGHTGPPKVAVVEAHPRTVNVASEGQLVAELLSDRHAKARVVALEDLAVYKGTLRVGTEPVDLVFRRFGLRDLLTYADLSHPLLQAYREGVVCAVNDFRSEVTRKRLLFELLTDGTVTNPRSQAEADTATPAVAWTRGLSRRKTTYRGHEVDLCSFTVKHREHLLLRPIDENNETPTYAGCACNADTWARAVHAGMQQQKYVVQEQLPPCTERFPFLQYGELQWKDVQVTVHAHVIEGEVRGAVARLDLPTTGSARPVGLAPVFVTAGEA